MDIGLPGHLQKHLLVIVWRLGCAAGFIKKPRMIKCGHIVAPVQLNGLLQKLFGFVHVALAIVKAARFPQDKGIVRAFENSRIKGGGCFVDPVLPGEHNAPAHKRKAVLAGKTLHGGLRIAITGPEQGLHPLEAAIVHFSIDNIFGHGRYSSRHAVDPVAYCRVGRKIGGDAYAAHPAFLAQLLEAANHAGWRKARCHKVLQANIVGFAFIKTAVIEHGGLACAACANGRGSASWSGQGHARDCHKQCAQGQILGALEPGCDMALGYMGKLMGQNPGKFLLLVHIHDHAAENKNITARNGKGVQGVMHDNGGFECKRLGRNGIYKSVQKVFHIMLYFRVFNDRHARTHHDIEFAAKLLFILQ